MSLVASAWTSTRITRVVVADLAEEAIGGAERVVDRTHVGPAQHGEHGDGGAVAGFDAGELLAGGIGREVGRAEHSAVRSKSGKTSSLR